jgi:hypothetical protein
MSRFAASWRVEHRTDRGAFLEGDPLPLDGLAISLFRRDVLAHSLQGCLAQIERFADHA